VLAADLSSQHSVGEIMTPAPATITAGATLFDATLEMTRRGVHHLPVLDDGERLLGMVTTSDLITARQEDPVYLVQRISRAGDVREIAALASESAQLLRHALTGGMQPQPVSQLLTAVSDAVLRRLVALAEEELGPAPAPWAWLAFGSQARAEQLLGADQDNGIVIDDGASDGDLAWYLSLAGSVCDGLAACGYAYCPGGIMATSDDCRLRLGQWRQRVRRWAQTPTPEALMRVGIFFDLRAVHGEATLARDLQQEMLAQGARNTIFLAALAASVLGSRPPLGVFRRFVVERDGEHRDRLDIKKRGVLPITEIARLHALAHGIPAVNTDDRLRELARAGHLSVASARNLADALHCVQRVRMQHQAEQLSAGAAPDNFVDPKALPRLVREALRDAFTVIDEAQAGLRQSYRAGLA
jgi:CBS domain-containing protein